MRLSSPSGIRETIGVVVSQCGACPLSIASSRNTICWDVGRDVLHFIRLFATLTRRRGVPNGMGRIEAQEPGSLSVFVRHSYDAHGYIYPLRRASSGIPSFLRFNVFLTRCSSFISALIPSSHSFRAKYNSQPPCSSTTSIHLPRPSPSLTKVRPLSLCCFARSS